MEPATNKTGATTRAVAITGVSAAGNAGTATKVLTACSQAKLVCQPRFAFVDMRYTTAARVAAQHAARLAPCR